MFIRHILWVGSSGKIAGFVLGLRERLPPQRTQRRTGELPEHLRLRAEFAVDTVRGRGARATRNHH